MSERWTELPVVVAGRRALDQALRQWKHYADEHRSLDHGRALGETGMLEDRLYDSCKAAAEGLEAAADESAKASLAPKTAFAPAHGWAALRWSAEKPRAAGWWGYHNGVSQAPTIFRVFESVSMPGKFYACSGDYGIDLVTEMAGWWLGPIELPSPHERTAPPNGPGSPDGAQRSNE